MIAKLVFLFALLTIAMAAPQYISGFGAGAGYGFPSSYYGGYNGYSGYSGYSPYSYGYGGYTSPYSYGYGYY